MRGRDFYVLHLSDLHIRNEGGSADRDVFYSKALSRLITDITEQIKRVTDANMVLVISGDILEAKYSNEPRTSDAVLKFFKDLHSAIGQKIGKNIVIVPGNHDKQRSKIDTLVSKEHVYNGLDSDKDSDFWWDEHLKSYEHFFELTSKIYSLFGILLKIHLVLK